MNFRKIIELSKLREVPPRVSTKKKIRPDMTKRIYNVPLIQKNYGRLIHQTR